jgi:hypothetical protein
MMKRRIFLGCWIMPILLRSFFSDFPDQHLLDLKKHYPRNMIGIDWNMRRLHQNLSCLRYSQ